MNVLVKEGILGAILLIMGVFDRLYIDWHGTITQPASLTVLLQREPFARHCHKSFIIYTIHPR